MDSGARRGRDAGAGRKLTMNSQAREYILYLRQMMSLNRDLLNYSDIPAPPPDFERDAAMAEFLRNRYGRDHAAELREHGNNMGYWLDQNEQDLFDDLSDYCTDVERQNLANVAVGYILRLHNNAFAERLPETWSLERPIYAIGINIGMLWVCASLCGSLLLEEQQQTDAARATYQRALQQYFSATQADFYKTMAANNLLDDDPLSLQSGALASVILRFVGLHELGHVIAGDVEDAAMCFVPETGAVTYGKSSFMDGGALHEMELSADRFAIDHMIAKTGSVEQMWNNILFVSAFLQMLEHVEILQGKPICDYHPAPEVRRRVLINRVRECLGEPAADVMTWLDQTMLSWR